MSKQYYVEAKTAAGGSTSGNGQVQTTAKVAYIDDKPYEIKEGDTILALMRRHFGKNAVPTLCDAPNLDPFGSCRVCSVDLALAKDGKTKAVASCHTPVSEGHYIFPNSANVQKLRKNIIELVLTD